MKILCSLSGLEFQCDHFPGTFHSREIQHPIFQLEQKRLLSYFGKWSGGELTKTDSYLLFLALLNSTELVHFRTPVWRTEQTDSIVAQNIEALGRAIIKINSVRSVEKVFPSYVISPDTRDLTNVKYWIENWLSGYDDWRAGYKSAHDSGKLIRREAALERLIKNPHKQARDYSAQLADWASIAGEFPECIVKSPFSGQNITLSEYWQQLIVKSSKSEQLFSIHRPDLIELLEHCEDKVSAGSIYAYNLFKVLRDALEKQHNFLGLGDQDLGKTTYTLLDSTTNVEDANIKMMIDSAPKELPRREQYLKLFDYMKAKARWDMACKFGRENQERQKPGDQSASDDGTNSGGGGGHQMNNQPSSWHQPNNPRG